MQTFAQKSTDWKITSELARLELDFFEQKAKLCSKRKVLDSALIFLEQSNKRLLTLNEYIKYFNNLQHIGNYSLQTYQHVQGIKTLQKGLTVYPNCLRSFNDSLQKVVEEKISFIYEQLVRLYGLTGAINTSLDYVVKLLNLRKRVFGEKHFYTAHAYSRLASAYESIDQYNNALNYHKRALTIYKNLPKKYQSFQKYSLNNLGVFHSKLSNYALALEYYNKALKISLKFNSKYSPFVAANYGNIANVHLNNGLFDLALEYYNKALRIRKRNLGDKHPFISNLYNQVGLIFHKQNKFGQAIKYYQKALVSNIESFSDTINVYALPKYFKGIYNNQTLLTTLTSKASLLARLNTQKTNLEQAHKTYQLADKLVDKMRKNLLRKSDELRLTSTVASMYEKALQVCWRLSKFEEDKQLDISDEGKTQVPNENLFTKKYNPYWVKAFYFAEKGKSSVLRKLATDASAKIQSNIPENVLEQERRLNGAILYYQRQLDRFQLKKQLSHRDSVQKQRFEDQRFELRRKYDQLLRDLEEKYPDYYDLKHSSYIASVADVQRRLDAKTALIEYVITEKQLFSFVITREDFKVYEQTIDKAKLKKEITRWLNNIQGGSDDAYLPRGHRFFKQFIQPLQAQLKDEKHLLIIPDALLSRLPFEAIITQKDVPVGKPEGYPYLIRKWGVTLYPSASLALMQHQRRGAKYTCDFLGLAPVFEKKPAQQGAFRKKLNALPFTKKEVETIHQLFQKQQKTSKVVTGEQVTEGMVKGLEGRYKFIHFATHGFLEDKTPALAFYPNQTIDSLQPQNNDGALSLEEIFNLKFKADMVVLSSCQGGAGKNVRGEGILAITRGFVYLGTPHIIYTLWSVNDKDAAELMIRFYDNMSKGKSYREALRLAKLSMLESAQTAWPKWWAGFTMMSKLK
ncbi:hypothetical protein BKI52_36175 [marine bacterium AO1-C]|nr:hypothetical protein BKI52_36175 [marine bacterium AO1-C]